MNGLPPIRSMPTRQVIGGGMPPCGLGGGRLSLAPLGGHVSLDFPGWMALEQHSQDIVIARCVDSTVFEVDTNGVEREALGGLIHFNMEIISALKGTNSGMIKFLSEYRPLKGEYYLVYANLNTRYSSVEAYRFILLGSNFSTNDLDGNAFDGQIQILLRRRLNNLDQQMQSDTGIQLKRDQFEMQRLEEGLRNK